MLRAMRTRLHTPAHGGGDARLGKAGNNGAIWFGLNLALAIVDPGNREAWLICALLGPIAIGLNYVIKLIVRRPRPDLGGLPPLGGAPSSLSFPSAHATSSFAVATAMTRVDALGRRSPSPRPRPRARPPLPGDALPLRCAGRRRHRRRPLA